MIARLFRNTLVIIFVIFYASAAKQPALEIPLLKVMVLEFPPFIFMENGTLKGFDVDLLEAVSSKGNFEFELIQANSLQEIFDQIQNGNVQLGIAGITLNENREKVMDFSHPYYSSGLSIMVLNSVDNSILNTLRTIFSPGIRKLIIGMVLFAIVCAHLIWFFERGRDSINDRYIPGLLEGIWWTIVTMSTVGYGDIAPKKLAGRIIAVFVIITGISFFGVIVAGITSSFTIQDLKWSVTEVSGLKYLKTAVVAGTTSESALKKREIPVIKSDSFQEACKMLKSKKVEALVFDTPVIQNYLIGEAAGEFKIAGNFDPQNYAMIMPQGSIHREMVNQSLLAVIESGEYKDINKKWFESQ